MDILTERTYGDPLLNHSRIAALWTAYLELDDVEITAHDVAICMMLVKISRAKADPTHMDTYVDIDGYARIAAMAGKEGL